REGTFPFRDASLPQKDANVQTRSQLKNTRPSPNLTLGSWICPPRSPEAIRALSGLHRRGLESGVRLFIPNIAGSDARVPTGEGKGESFSCTQLAGRAPGRRCLARVQCLTGRSAVLPQSLPQWPGPRVPAADQIKDGHKVNSPRTKLQELWKTPHIQTIHIPKSMMETSFRKHSDLTLGQKRYLCSIAKIYNANYLRTLMKRQYLHVIQRSSQKPGVLTHHRSHLGSRYSQKQHYPCTTWRHQLERENSGPSNMAAASAPEMIIQHSLWRPVRNKEGSVS
uniref:Family with sequence similarity 216 member A n=1 Tax=Sus scrofa TaxID=9823 RepID=A0A8D1QZQ8_PIG